jgi:hypothetical protein
MAQYVDVSTLDGNFKESYANKIKDLVPEGVVLYNKIDFNGADKQPGNFYHAPVSLSLEHGFSYGGDTGAVFTLQNSIASSMEDAQVRGCELVLRSAISVGAAARSVSGKNSFVQATKELVRVMLKSMHIRLESQLMYGQVGIGRVESLTGTTLKICDAEWAAGIWSGSKNMQIQIRSQAGTVRGTASVVTVDLAAKTVEIDSAPVGVTGNADPENAAADIIWYAGAFGKEFAGLHKIITNTGTIFNIDASQHDLFKGNVIEAGTDATTGAVFISFDLIEKAVTRAMEKGLMKKTVTALINPKHWDKLLSDLGAKRMIDSSYSTKQIEDGTQSIKFNGQNGVIEVETSLFVKEGFAYVLPMDALERIGSTEVTFQMPGMQEGRFFRLLENENGYELRLYTDQALFSNEIGQLSVIKYLKTA